MKIVHICTTQYTDGWTYQENMLAKYHKKMGLETTVITSMYCYKEGKLVEDENTHFIDVNGVKIIRLKIKSEGFLKKIPTYELFYETLVKEKPDIIFSHGCQYKDAVLVAKYVKNNPYVKLFVDNHADFSNSATNFISKQILHKIIWKHYAQLLLPYTEVFWGVMPARVDFLVDLYDLPKEKCKLLVMGADDELVYQSDDKEKIHALREKYGVSSNDFLIVTGGKIDKAKMQTAYLMEAISKINSTNVKLIIFGSIENEIYETIMRWVDNKKIYYIGWIPADESYEYFAAADLVVFPGRHSVFWEQVAGEGIPMVVKEWKGTRHIDLGGNVKFLKGDGVDEIKNVIEELVNNPNEYRKMKECALKKGKTYFSYEGIAKNSIEMENI